MKNIGSRSRSWSRIFKVSVSEGVVSVSNGQVSVSVLVSDDEVSVSVSDDVAETLSLAICKLLFMGCWLDIDINFKSLHSLQARTYDGSCHTNIFHRAIMLHVY